MWRMSERKESGAVQQLASICISLARTSSGSKATCWNLVWQLLFVCFFLADGEHFAGIKGKSEVPEIMCLDTGPLKMMEGDQVDKYLVSLPMHWNSSESCSIPSLRLPQGLKLLWDKAVVAHSGNLLNKEHSTPAFFTLFHSPFLYWYFLGSPSK